MINNRPNILFVFSDQHRASAMGCYGNPHVQTPHFDRFAAQGARMQTAISTTPVCGPFRASLISGMQAHRTNYITNYLQFKPVGPCVGEVFSNAGYATGYIGKWHLYFPQSKNGVPDEDAPGKGYVPPEERYGFRDFWRGFNGSHKYYSWEYFRDNDPAPVSVEGFQPETQVDQALEFITAQQGAKRPWCLFMSWGPPHTPYRAPAGYTERYKNVPAPANVPPGQPTDHARKSLPGYYGLVTALDDAFGRLMQELETLGAADNTIVVYTSDHGDMIGCHGYKGNKRWPYDESIRVPFIIRWPGHIPAGSVVTNPIGTPDIFPTLADLAGLAVPGGLDGKSARLALLGGEEAECDEYVYLTMPYAYVPWPGWRALRSSRYLYARTKDAPWLLFDLQKDPLEQANLIHDPGHAQLATDLDLLLTKMMRELDDSWDLSVQEGDWELWFPGSSKMKNNDLGVPWPGGPYPYGNV